VAAAVDGWVRHAGPVTSGSIVHKDDVLATFYNRDFLTAQQTYLYALNTMDRFQENESADQLTLTRAQMRAASENLEFLGMGEIQLKEIARTREISNEIELRSPVAGLVQTRNAFPGLRFDRGSELFRIADLSHVWILADIFENDARLLRTVRRAVARYQDRTLPVQLSNSLPQFDPVSRALKVRLETDNADLMLRPDMFVDVEFEVSLPPAIAVPVEAVIDSGLHKTVYLETADGSFVPRQVETGWRLGDSVEIVSGLTAGERIVASGNFLLDSESRMRLSRSR
jgi:Cu(I)/Ag(I) efflux system membrane fusion protein